MNARFLPVLSLSALLLTGCGTASNADSDASQGGSSSATTQVAPAESTAQGEIDPDTIDASEGGVTGGDPVSRLKEQFPGYPVLVDLTSIDTRVAGSLEGNTYNNKVVALAPGLYAPYNANFTDLDEYYDTGIVYGDSMMRDEYLHDTGGSTWGGVQPGTQEPLQ